MDNQLENLKLQHMRAIASHLQAMIECDNQHRFWHLLTTLSRSTGTFMGELNSYIEEHDDN